MASRDLLLGRHPNQPPNQTPTTWYHARMTTPTTFHELAARLHDSDLFFVQIGAMDGVVDDPLREHVLASGWRGLLVEPLPDMFERLRANYAGREGLRFERTAIVDRSGPVEMFRVDPQQLARFPSWVGGLSSLYCDRNNLSKPRIRRHVQRVTVPGKTLGGVGRERGGADRLAGDRHGGARLARAAAVRLRAVFADDHLPGGLQSDATGADANATVAGAAWV